MIECKLSRSDHQVADLAVDPFSDAGLSKLWPRTHIKGEVRWSDAHEQKAL